MKFFYAILLLGFCQSIFSFPTEEVKTEAATEDNELDEQILSKIEQFYGRSLDEILPEIADKLGELDENTDAEDVSSEELTDNDNKRWEQSQVMARRRWKKILHKIKHVGGKVLGSAATTIAGKAIAGALTG